MRFLADRCAGARLAEWPRSRGHDVVESRERRPDPGDRALLEWVASEGRLLVTIDTNFGELVFVEGVSHCGLVRLPDVSAKRRIALMEQVLERHAGALETRAIVTIRGGRIRVSHPPS